MASPITNKDDFDAASLLLEFGSRAVDHTSAAQKASVTAAAAQTVFAPAVDATRSNLAARRVRAAKPRASRGVAAEAPKTEGNKLKASKRGRAEVTGGKAAKTAKKLNPARRAKTPGRSTPPRESKVARKVTMPVTAKTPGRSRAVRQTKVSRAMTHQDIVRLDIKEEGRYVELPRIFIRGARDSANPVAMITLVKKVLGISLVYIGNAYHTPRHDAQYTFTITRTGDHSYQMSYAREKITRFCGQLVDLTLKTEKGVFVKNKFESRAVSAPSKEYKNPFKGLTVRKVEFGKPFGSIGIDPLMAMKDASDPAEAKIMNQLASAASITGKQCAWRTKEMGDLIQRMARYYAVKDSRGEVCYAAEGTAACVVAQSDGSSVGSGKTGGTDKSPTSVADLLTLSGSKGYPKEDGQASD